MSQNKRPMLLGRKVGMTQVFTEEGRRIPVTVLEVGPCRVLQVKTVERDGYEALQVGFDVRRKAANKPLSGVFAKAGVRAMGYVGEVPVVDGREVAAGEDLTVALLDGVKAVDVAGIMKGRGFSGTIRRHNFRSGPRSHGCKNVREIGSSGMAFPSRVMPGKKMPGHWGAARIKVKNLKVVRLDAEKHLLLVTGAVPGPTGGYVVVQESTYAG